MPSDSLMTIETVTAAFFGFSFLVPPTLSAGVSTRKEAIQMGIELYGMR
jgi:hypothetical protein